MAWKPEENKKKTKLYFDTIFQRHPSVTDCLLILATMTMALGEKAS
jgi:hypothetical protein